MATNRYEEIARAAITLFDQKGYHATSVQDIADAVGLQKGSLYHYIESKEELLLRIASQSINGFNRELEIIRNRKTAAKDRLIQAIHHHFNIVTGDIQMTTVLLREAFLLGDEQQSAVKQATDRYLDLWVDIIKEGMDNHEFRPGDARLTALSILGSCNWVYRWYDGNGSKTPQQIADYFCELSLKGILAG
ncbi:MAG: TetR/AcrR family transcriptional regulator [Bacilli bacterium]